MKTSYPSLVKSNVVFIVCTLFVCGVRAEEILPIGENAIKVFFSDVSGVGAGVTTENPVKDYFGIGDSDSLYIWVDPGDTSFSGVSLAVRPAVAGVISLDKRPVVYNPDIVLASDGSDTGYDRWAGIGYSHWVYDQDPELTDSFLGDAAFDNYAVGIDPALDGSQGPRDPLYDTLAGAFLFARIDYEVVGIGTTPLYLEIGEYGIITDFGGAHTSEVSVYLGAGEVLPSNALNAWSQRLIPSVLPDAIINVFPEVPGGGSHRVPEPSGFMRLALGVLAPLFGPRPRRRRFAHEHVR